MRKVLTVTVIEKLKPPKAGQLDVFDLGAPGLALRVSYGGAKSFISMYRYAGRLHRRTLGRWPLMSLAAARDAWRLERDALSRGENPHHTMAADTFASVMAEWLQRDQGDKRSFRRVSLRMERAALPVLDERLIGTITRRDIARVVDAVVDRGKLVEARRLHAQLHRMFQWCVGRGIVAVNPATGLPKPGAEATRERVLDHQEVAAVWHACGAAGPLFGAIIRLLLLLGARRDEIGLLRWDEIAGTEIRLAGVRTKTGVPHIIPLPEMAQDILRAVPRIANSPFVFTLTGLGPVTAWAKTKRRLDKAVADSMGEAPPPWHFHDFRRVVASNLQRLGTRLEVIEEVLGHTGGTRAGVAGIYQRYKYHAEVRAALDLWSHDMARIVGTTAPARIIVPMREAVR
jgi:integrase